MLIRIAGTVSESIVDGPGIRYTIFTQGCPHHCEGCHNPETHDFSGGRLADTDKIYNHIAENPLLKGVTFSGGEPFCQPAPLYDLAKRIKENTKLDIMAYTGFTFEQLVEKGEKFDVTVLDPPRKGCEKESLDYAIKLSEKAIVYVSCNPSTLARDLKYLHENGFTTRYIQPVDMFCHSYHIESVAWLEKN